MPRTTPTPTQDTAKGRSAASPLRAETAGDYLRFLSALDHAAVPAALLWVLLRAGAHKAECRLSLNEVAKEGGMGRSSLNNAAKRLASLGVLTVDWGKSGSKTLWRLHEARLVKYLKSCANKVSRLPAGVRPALSAVNV